MTLRSLLQADQELVDAAAYYEDQGSGLGDRFVDKATEVLAQIQRQPEAWPLFQDSKQVRRARLGRFPYYVVFLPLQKEVVVLAYAHERRHPGYWEDRLADA